MTEYEYKKVFKAVRPSMELMEKLREMDGAENISKQRNVPKRLVACCMALVLLFCLGTAAYATDLMGVSTWINRMLAYTGIDFGHTYAMTDDGYVQIGSTDKLNVQILKDAELLWEHAIDLRAEGDKMILTFDERRFDVTGIWGENGMGSGEISLLSGGESCNLKLERLNSSYVIDITIGEKTESFLWDERWPFMER